MLAMRITVLLGSTISLIFCSHNVHSKIKAIKILDKLPSSDHLPLQMTLGVD